ERLGAGSIPVNCGDVWAKCVARLPPIRTWSGHCSRPPVPVQVSGTSWTPWRTCSVDMSRRARDDPPGSAKSSMVTREPTRIVLAKVGLDGHDRGIKVVARGLRDEGFHVIYAGLWQSPEAVVRAVGDEDARWLGLSLLSGAHMALVPRVLES